MLRSEGSIPVDVGAEPRHRLAQEAAAATDVEQAQTGERARLEGIATEPGRDLLVDVGEPDRD